jgi:hypothetical protein
MFAAGFADESARHFRVLVLGDHLPCLFIGKTTINLSQDLLFADARIFQFNQRGA